MNWLRLPILAKEIMAINYWAEFEYGEYYHLYNRSAGREPVFQQEQWVNFFQEKWEKLLSPYLDTLAYCYIPNHYHFLVRIKQEEDWPFEKLGLEKTRAATELRVGEGSMDAFLLDQFRRLLSGFSLSYNRRNNRQGPVFEQRFKRIKLRTTKRLWWQLCYIHHNPIHHNLAFDYETWPFCSYQTWQATNWETLPPFLTWLGDSPEEAMDNFDRAHRSFRQDWQENLPLDVDVDVQ
ncbi:MAG: hypothetical protein KDC54_02105 [Lewinella sp.]|nr:hypothetical protein [Lewinella sp.]